MKIKIEINDELIAKYLAGEASPEEAIALDDWLQDPGNRRHFQGMQEMWAVSFPSRSSRPVDVPKAWKKVREEENGRPQRLGEAPRPLKLDFILKIAASVLVILVAGGIFYTNKSSKVADISLDSGDSLKHVRFEEHSLVVLNRNTKLVYPKSFGKHDRQVQLRDGEAFFNVSPDPVKPFIVNTPIATIRVLGTAFNVLVNSDTVEVSVDHGRVLVHTSTDSVYLEAGQAAFVHPGEKSLKIVDSNINTWAYATHKFVFNNTSVREVFQYVEKAQDCIIHLANPEIGNCKLTATFESVSTDYMLNLVTEALNLSVVKNDDRTFTVEGEGCH